jgi:hypothetical protein
MVPGLSVNFFFVWVRSMVRFKKSRFIFTLKKQNKFKRKSEDTPVTTEHKWVNCKSFEQMYNIHQGNFTRHDN